MLRSTDRAIPDISFPVGLQSLSSFTTSFTWMFDEPPAADRARFPTASDDALVPTCELRAYGRPQRRTFREDAQGRPLQRCADRHRPQGARDTEDHRHGGLGQRPGGGAGLGMEVRIDVTLPQIGDFRRPTVAPAGHEDVAIVLMPIPDPRCSTPRPPSGCAGSSRRVRGAVCLTTDDCYAVYEELTGRGVESPEQRPYAFDSGLRDPSGDHLRLNQVPMPA